MLVLKGEEAANHAADAVCKMARGYYSETFDVHHAPSNAASEQRSDAHEMPEVTTPWEARGHRNFGPANREVWDGSRSRDRGRQGDDHVG